MATTEINGTSIAYEVKGDGPPLVFLHCWTGNKAFFFEQVKEFSSEYRCICLDFPGHGDSGECEEYSVEGFGEIAVGLLEKLGVEEAVFAGHSLGGMVCFYLALEHPEMVRGLILLDTTSYLSGFLEQRLVAAVAVPLGRFGFKLGKGVVAGVAATHPLAGPRARIITGRECSKVSNRAVSMTLNSARKYNVTPRLGEIGCPALIVVGTGDVLADMRHALRMARRLPDSTLKVVRGAGHMALFEKPKVVNRAIRSFLNRVYPPRQAKTKVRVRKVTP